VNTNLYTGGTSVYIQAITILYTGWPWIYIRGDHEYIQSEQDSIYGVNTSLYTGWTWIYIQDDHEYIYRVNMSMYRVNKSLYTGWTWVCIQGDHESIYRWAWIHMQASMNLHTGWTWLVIRDEHVYRMNMSLYRGWTCVYIRVYGAHESMGWTWVYIRGERKYINWVNKSLYTECKWVCIQGERGWSLFPCKVSVFKSWVSNLLWQRATPFTVGRFAVRTWENNSMLYLTAHMFMLFDVIYIIYKCGRGPHSTTWRTAVWSLLV
jgi:hypothetical protein